MFEQAPAVACDGDDTKQGDKDEFVLSPSGGMCGGYTGDKCSHVVIFDKIRSKRNPFFSNVTKWAEFVMIRVGWAQCWGIVGSCAGGIVDLR